MRKRSALARLAELETLAVRCSRRTARGPPACDPLVPAIGAWRTAVNEAADARVRPAGVRGVCKTWVKLFPLPIPNAWTHWSGELGGLARRCRPKPRCQGCGSISSSDRCSCSRPRWSSVNTQQAVEEVETSITRGHAELEGLPDVSSGWRRSRPVEMLQRRHDAWVQWCEVEQQHAAAVIHAAEAQEAWQSADAAVRLAASQAHLRDHAVQLAAHARGRPAVRGVRLAESPAPPDRTRGAVRSGRLAGTCAGAAGATMRLHGDATKLSGLLERLAAEAGPYGSGARATGRRAVGARGRSGPTKGAVSRAAAQLQVLVGQRPSATERRHRGPTGRTTLRCPGADGDDTLASSEHIVEQRRLDHPSVAARVCHLEAVRDPQRV